MRVLNDYLLPATTVALSETSASQELDHIAFIDLMASVTDVTPGDKTFTDADVNVTDDEVTVTAHGFFTGLKVQVSNPGTLPTGLSAATDYYLIVVDANTIQFATSQANAAAGTAINITGAGSGTTTVEVNTTLAGAVKLQKNDEPSSLTGVWFDIGSSSQSFSGTTTLNWGDTLPYKDIGYRAIRAVVTTTSGAATVAVRINGKGA